MNEKEIGKEKAVRRDLSSILSALPETFQAERKELLSMLLRDGILHRSPTQPVVSRDGVQARWMLNSLGVTLSSRGAELAGRCLLELLKNFDGRQLATYGLIGVPIFQSCILQSGGRYRGLLVRREAKKYGAMRVIEGEINPNEPVILVDDSIASGTSFLEACQRLEPAGLRVEGAVCLVRFGWQSGYSVLQDRGYHVEALYDIFDDVMVSMEGEPKPVPNPTKIMPKFEWSGERAPEGLHPADLARIALKEYLTTGKLLRPPERLDREYDSSGGVYVSLRSQSNIHLRHARDGFWHFPGELRPSTAENIVYASLLTAQHLLKKGQGMERLESSHLAVTFFSALEECTVGQLDNDRYGIVVCSRERVSTMGGALPSMPGIGNEFQQFRHARIRNGKLASFEPYKIYRHDVAKFVEPGAQWQRTGVPKQAQQGADENSKRLAAIAERARDIAIAHKFGCAETTAPLAHGNLPQGFHSLFVTVYIWGRLRGCMGNSISNLDTDLRTLVLGGLADERFADYEISSPEAIAVSVSFLSNPVTIGDLPPEEVARRTIHGKQLLRVSQKERHGMLLPFFAAMHDLTPNAYALEVIDKAGITRPPYTWQLMDCATWLADSEGAGVMEGAFRVDNQPELPPEKLLPELAAMYAGYIVRQQKEDGFFYESYEPFRNRLHSGLTPPRLAHAAWVLMRAANILKTPSIQEAAEKTVEVLLRAMRVNEAGTWLEFGSLIPSVSEISFLVLALCEFPKGHYKRRLVRSLADTLWNSIDRHGRIASHRTSQKVAESNQDYAPGQVMLALAVAAASGLTEINQSKLQNAFRYYRHRFRYKRDFGQVSWIMQAFTRWWQIQPDPEFSSLVDEIGDWILEFQNERAGSFMTDHQPDTPGFTTAVYLEGIGAAAGITQREKYLSAYVRGMHFLKRLTILPSHASVLPNSDCALGGVRQSLYTSFIRLDFVQHALSAALEQYSYFSAGTAPAHTHIEPAVAAAH